MTAEERQSFWWDLGYAFTIFVILVGLSAVMPAAQVSCLAIFAFVGWAGIAWGRLMRSWYLTQTATEPGERFLDRRWPRTADRPYKYVRLAPVTPDEYAISQAHTGAPFPVVAGEEWTSVWNPTPGRHRVTR